MSSIDGFITQAYWRPGLVELTAAHGPSFAEGTKIYIAPDLVRVIRALIPEDGEAVTFVDVNNLAVYVQESPRIVAQKVQMAIEGKAPRHKGDIADV